MVSLHIGYLHQIYTSFTRDHVRRRPIQADSTRLPSLSLLLQSVVAVTIYLSKYTEDFGSMNEAYIESFAGPTKPSRTCIGVKSLPAGTDVEITWCVVLLVPWYMLGSLTPSYSYFALRQHRRSMLDFSSCHQSCLHHPSSSSFPLRRRNLSLFFPGVRLRKHWISR